MWGFLFKGCSEVEKAEEVKENELAGKTSKRQINIKETKRTVFCERDLMWYKSN